MKITSPAYITFLRQRNVGIAAASILALSVVAWATVGKKVFDRPSEEALARVPKDAVAIAVIDLHPSLQQLSALSHWKELFDVLQSALPHGEETLTSRRYRWAKDLLPATRGSAVAYALEPRNNFSNYDSVAIIPLNDVDLAKSILEREFGKEQGGLTPIYVREGIYAEIEDKTLLISSDKAAFSSVLPEGKKELSILSDPGFGPSRAAVDRDANLFVVVPGAAIRHFADRQFNNNNDYADAARAAGWASLGIAIRSEGFAISGNVPISAERYAPLRQLAKAKPIDPKIYGSLPEGAYGAVVLSQPIQWFRCIEDAVDPRDSVGYQIHQVEDFAQRELNFDSDRGQAFSGNAILAAYPSTDSPGAGGDVLAILDDSNGANPAETVSEAKRAVENALGRSREGRVVTELTEDGLEGYEIARELREETERDLLRTADPDVRTYLRDKTIAVATDGGAVLAASSEALLTKAVALRHGKGQGLQSDDMLTKTSTAEGSQLALNVNVGRIAHAANAMIPWDRFDRADWIMAPGEKPALLALAHRAVEAVESQAGVASLSLGWNETGMSFKAFVPFDAKKIAGLIQDSKADLSTVERGKLDETHKSDNYTLAYSLKWKMDGYARRNDGRLLPSGDDSTIFSKLIKDSVAKGDVELPTAIEDQSPFPKGSSWHFNPAIGPRKQEELPKTKFPLAWLAQNDHDKPYLMILSDGSVNEPSIEDAKDLMQAGSEKGIRESMAKQHADELEAKRLADVKRKAEEAAAHQAQLSSRLDGLIDRLGFQILGAADFNGLDKASLRILRNSIYAHHGYRFQKPELISFFSSKPYYHPTTNDVHAIEVSLTPQEHQNVILIASLESRR